MNILSPGRQYVALIPASVHHSEEMFDTLRDSLERGGAKIVEMFVLPTAQVQFVDVTGEETLPEVPTTLEAFQRAEAAAADRARGSFGHDH